MQAWILTFREGLGCEERERERDWIWVVEGAVFASKEGSIMRRESVV